MSSKKDSPRRSNKKRATPDVLRLAWWHKPLWLLVKVALLLLVVLAFYFFLTSVSKIGATFASLLCSVEPLAATLTAVVWLGVSFTGYDWVGTGLILGTVALLTLAKEQAKEGS